MENWHITDEEIAPLPLWGRAVFAVRCAQHALAECGWFQFPLPEDHLKTALRALLIAEQAATSGRGDGDHPLEKKWKFEGDDPQSLQGREGCHIEDIDPAADEDEADVTV